MVAKVAARNRSAQADSRTTQTKRRLILSKRDMHNESGSAVPGWVSK